MADAEHFTVELLDKVKTQTNFELLGTDARSAEPAKETAGLPARIIPTTVGGLCDRKVGLYPQEQPRWAVLPIRPAAGGAAGRIQLQGIPLDNGPRRG